MTILNNGTRNQYTATAAQTVFVYTYEIFDEDDLKVYRGGVLLSKTNDYTVAGVGAENGGSITLTTGATAGDIYTLQRVTAPERLTDWQNSGNVLSEELNAEEDRQWAVIQEILSDQDRFLKFSDTTTQTLPATIEAGIAGQLCRWKSDASGVESIPVSSITPSGEVTTDYALSKPNATAVKAIVTSTVIDGQAVVVTDTITGGAFILKNTVSHGFLDSTDIIVIDTDWYAQRVTAPREARQNKIINGNFDVWQRQTTQSSSSAPTTASDDRWQNLTLGSTRVHSRQAFTLGQTDVPNNPIYYSRTVVTSVAGAGNISRKGQAIPGLAQFSGKYVVLTFWAKADSSKDIATEFKLDYGAGGSSDVTGATVTTHSLTTSWQKFTIVTQIQDLTGDTIGNFDHLGIIFWFDAGSNYDARTNSLGQQSGTFEIAQVQLKKGYAESEFEDRSFDEELKLCLPYYRKSYDYDVFAGAIDSNGAISYVASGTRGAQSSVNFDAMANTSAANTTLYAPTTGNSGNITDITASADLSATVPSSTAGDSGFTVAATHVDGNEYKYHYTIETDIWSANL